MRRDGAALLLGLLLCGCKAENPTQIIVAVATDLRVPQELDGLVFRVEYRGKAHAQHTYDLDPSRTPHLELPATMALTADRDTNERVAVVVSGTRAGAKRVERRAWLYFLKGRRLLLRMLLLRRCLGAACPADQTCGESGCASDYVNSDTLPEYTEEAAFAPLEASTPRDGRPEAAPDARGDGPRDGAPPADGTPRDTSPAEKPWADQKWADTWGPKPLGSPCGGSTQCASGFCVDGVCCNELCAGTCVACTYALKGSGSDGTCGSIVFGSDPQGECASGEGCGVAGTKHCACSDGYQNGSESDVDCGGSVCSKCALGKTCTSSSDCGALNCVNKQCCAGNCPAIPDCRDCLTCACLSKPNCASCPGDCGCP